MTGPLIRVLDAIDSGAGTLGEIEQATGLAREVVGASVHHLVRLGRLEARELSLGCPAGGCGTCASGTAAGSAGCGAPGPSTGRRGPALVALTRRRAESA